MACDIFTDADRALFAKTGRREADIRVQLARFRTGFPYAKLLRPCTVKDGITVIPSAEFAALSVLFTAAARAGRLMKFIPASGAASRMFHALLAIQARENTPDPTQHTASVDPHDADLRDFVHFSHHLPRFAFYEALDAVLTQKGYSLSELRTTGRFGPILDALLSPSGLNYAHLPKALLHFHRYGKLSRTPLEEHLVEAAALMLDDARVARLHLTVSPTHVEAMQYLLERVRDRYELDGVRFAVDLSTQKPSTDTIAVDVENRPFRLSDGTLLFRPAGHGALLENLHDVQGDIVWLKNIDNVVPDHLKHDTYVSTKGLVGYLLRVQQTLFGYMERLTARQVDQPLRDEMVQFAREKLCLTFPADMEDQPLDTQIDRLMTQFNRPLRVCGVVPNTGEPGGGPFWVEAADGTVSLQIVETSQIDPDSADQQAILAASTHFNPVNLVCGVRDFRGQPFDLPRYVDPETGFISTKSHGGRALKAMELPGLWNGAMADWNTVFVEVPLSTFNPVKTVLDLLRDAHQPPE